tara:strand:+ start:118 stop:912 length:795 start_codon:yes stop_codon:yes gene_type:complete
MIKKGINYLIFSHFWISLGAVGLLIGNYKILKIDVNPLYLALTFFATLFGYLLQYSGNQKLNKWRPLQSIWVDENKMLILILKWISFIISLVLALIIFDFKHVLLSLPFLLAVLFYKKKLSFFQELRTFPAIKIFLIAACWSWVCSVLPQLLTKDSSINLVNLVCNFVFIIAITIPFDVRDLNSDSESIVTIPILLGKNKAVLLSMVLIGLLLSHFIFIQKFEFSLYFILVLLTLIPSFFTKNEYYYLFIIDGVLVVFPIFAIW